MANSVLDVLRARGFIAQVTDQDGVLDYLGKTAACYIGFDPTADSLHVGSLVPILSLVHMQRHGHRPIVLLGGGTGLVGDPSGKTEMRKMLSVEQIHSNALALKRQLSRFLDFSDGRALFLNNADWLVDIRYIEFLRDVGRHFSVNRMLTAESYKQRLETGLSFIEFSYMLLQAYDFYYLAESHNCFLQMGGNDQWGNIVAGIDLIRRKASKSAFGITFPLMTTASGAKMGKTATGAVWLSAEKTTPFDFYQYWVNTEDGDVARFLNMYTFIPLDEITKVQTLQGQELNACKTVLAYEVTAIVHGKEAAVESYESAAKVFGNRRLDQDLLPSSTIPREITTQGESIPTTLVELEKLEKGVPAFELFYETGLCSSRSAARRLIEQGGAYINKDRVKEFDSPVGISHLLDEEMLLKAGKKKVHRIRIKS